MSPDWLSPEERGRVLRYLDEAFGIPAEALAGHRLLRRGAHLWAVREECAGACAVFPHEQAGLKLLKQVGEGRYKPNTHGFQLFGRWSTRGIVDLDDADLRGIVSGRSLPWTGEPGPVLLRWRGWTVGVGLARGSQLTSQLPRAVTENLKL